MLAAPDLFDLTHFAYRSLFAGTTFAWEVLPHLEAYIRDQFATRLRPAVQTMLPPGAFIEGDVFIGTDTVVEPGALIRGPAIIGRACQIRQGAYIRGNVIVGDGCVVGHATEVKQSVLLNHAHAPHFAYVGDSILGNGVNLGAGVRLANFPLALPGAAAREDGPSIRLQLADQVLDTGLLKLGAILGDRVQLGCNVVTNPGCIIGPETVVYPLVLLRKGYYPAASIVKAGERPIVIPQRRP